MPDANINRNPNSNYKREGNVTISYYDRPNDIQHQKGNTECGIYALHFLETMLKGMDFEKYIENKNSDKYMENFRNYYFIDE